MEQQLSQETSRNGNVQLNQAVILPKKGTIRYRLIDFSGRRTIIHEAKPSTSGRYVNDKYAIDCPIDGSALFNGGTEAWIDVNHGIQITNFDGIRGWVGPDGKWSYRAEVGKMWGLILAAKGGELLKWAKLAVLLTGITLAALIISVVVLSGNIK